MRVLAIAGSPRRGGNTDLLLARAVSAITRTGATVDSVVLCRLRVAPCTACGDCDKTGQCIVQDDFQSLCATILASDAILLASPVYFTNVTAQTKAFIDRFQCLWAMKHVLKQPIPPPPASAKRSAAFISTAGASRMSFDCTLTTVRAFCSTLEADLVGSLCVNAIDERGAVRNRPEILTQAESLGATLVAAMTTSRGAHGRSDEAEPPV